MLADGLEELADEAFRRPIGEADLAAWLADTNQFGRRALLVRREHHAKGRDDDIERPVLEGQRLGIGFVKLDMEPLGGGTLPSSLEQGRHVVGGDDIGPAPGGSQRCIAVARRNVEHPLPSAQVERLAEVLADDLQGGSHHGIIAR